MIVSLHGNSLTFSFLGAFVDICFQGVLGARLLISDIARKVIDHVGH